MKIWLSKSSTVNGKCLRDTDSDVCSIEEFYNFTLVSKSIDIGDET